MEENKIISTLKFYYLATSLKEKIRSGWIKWNVSKDRLESIAEHIYGTCILAISIDSEFNTSIDLNKVLRMLVLHELEEVIIGDITPYDNVPEAEKLTLGRKAVSEVLDGLIKKEEYEELLNEFNAHETKESKFAFYCDKLEADLQAKKYDEYCNIFNPDDKKMIEEGWNKNFIENGATTISDLFISYDMKHFDELFCSIALYIKNNDIPKS